MDELVIPGTGQSYYAVVSVTDGTVRYKASRAKIRLLVDMMNGRLQQAIDKGEDHYRLSLDDNDTLQEFFENEPAEAYVEVINMVAEEMEALASRTIDKTNSTLAEAEQIEKESNSIGQIFAAIVGVLIFIFIIIALSR